MLEPLDGRGVLLATAAPFVAPLATAAAGWELTVADGATSGGEGAGLGGWTGESGGAGIERAGDGGDGEGGGAAGSGDGGGRDGNVTGSGGDDGDGNGGDGDGAVGGGGSIGAAVGSWTGVAPVAERSVLKNSRLVCELVMRQLTGTHWKEWPTL